MVTFMTGTKQSPTGYCQLFAKSYFEDVYLTNQDVESYDSKELNHFQN